MALRKLRPALLTLAVICSATALAADNQSRQGKGQRQGPPPEAYTACEGKKSGDTAEFESPRGDMVSGTCEQQGDQLVLRPDRQKQGATGRQGQGGMQEQGGMQRQQRRGQFGPPPEAYTACDGKNSGDTAEFASPRGDMVSGTCEQEGDKLVLRPDRHPAR